MKLAGSLLAALALATPLWAATTAPQAKLKHIESTTQSIRHLAPTSPVKVSFPTGKRFKEIVRAELQAVVDLQLIAAQERTHHLPVVVLSAHGAPGRRAPGRPGAES